MTECKSTCDFQPRYDYGEPTIAKAGNIDAYDLMQIMEASKKKTYVRDVCNRCGKVIERLK